MVFCGSGWTVAQLDIKFSRKLVKPYLVKMHLKRSLEWVQSFCTRYHEICLSFKENFRCIQLWVVKINTLFFSSHCERLTMPHSLRLIQLNQLEDPWGMMDELGLFHTLLNSFLHVRVPGLLIRKAREQVIDEGKEEGFVLVHQFTEVHILQHPHHNLVLTVSRVRSLRCSQCTENGEDVSESEIVMYLWWGDRLDDLLCGLIWGGSFKSWFPINGALFFKELQGNIPFWDPL